MISGFWQKCGFWSNELIQKWKNNEDWIWFHAVSVGEINAIWPLVKSLREKKDSYGYMISTTTNAGFNRLKQLTNNTNIFIFYFPFDLPWIVKSLLNKVNVKALIIAETEIWPTVLSECERRNIPTILTNARLSDRSFKNYKTFKFFFKGVINRFSEVLSQSESDSHKFKELGLEKSKLKTLGNIKFSIDENLNNKQSDFIRAKNTDIKIIFASTHDGEEEIAVNVYKNLLHEYKNIQLIIAPRHIERVQQIKKIISRNSFHPVLRTSSDKIISSNEILVLNTIGELVDFYKIAQITVLGGTFTKIGGHNIIEPVRAESYTIIGPYNYKIRELTALFKNEDAIVQVKDVSELEYRLKEAISNKELRETKIRNGKRIIKRNQNVLKETTERIISYL